MANAMICVYFCKDMQILQQVSGCAKSRANCDCLQKPHKASKKIGTLAVRCRYWKALQNLAKSAYKNFRQMAKILLTIDCKLCIIV